MRGRRHDVGGNNRAFHHFTVDRRVIASGAPVAREQCMVGRRDERARPTGKITDAKLRESRWIAPVYVHQRNGQFREQRRRLR